MLVLYKRLLRSKYSRTRNDAIKKLAGYKNKHAVPLLLTALDDPEPGNRLLAIKALEERAVPEAIGPLVEQLAHQWDNIRKAAEEALRGIARRSDNSQVFYNCLITTIDNNGLSARDFELIIRILVPLAGAKAIDPLLKILGEESRGTTAGASLVSLGSQVYEPLIIALGRSDIKEVKNAIYALGKLKDPRAIEHLKKLLDGPLRRSAVQALGKLGDKTQTERMIDRIFASAPCQRNKCDWGGLDDLFEDYFNLIPDSCTYTESKETAGISDRVTHWTYQVSTHAVQQLCNINSPVSSNILIKIRNLRDINNKPVYEHEVHGTTYQTLSFQPHRDLAETELKRRNNPKYDPSAYLEKDAWKIR